MDVLANAAAAWFNCGRIVGLAEVARSFSYKLNTGNYQSQDFFCSQKAQCELRDAEAISAKLYAFCKSQVTEAVRTAEKELARGAIRRN